MTFIENFMSAAIIKHAHYINVTFMLTTGESATGTGSSHGNHSTGDLKRETVYLREEFRALDKLELLGPGTPTFAKAKMAGNESDIGAISCIFPVDLSNSSSLVQDIKG
jgi:hypothetical protein